MPAATGYSLSGPANGPVNLASGVFTVTPNGVASDTVTISSGLAGTFSPATLTFTASSAPQTFTFTPSAAGSGTINLSSAGSLTVPTGITYTAVLVPISYITTAGAAAIAAAGSSGPLINITQFKIGSDLLIFDSAATLQALTSVQSGGVNSAVYTQATSGQLQYTVLGPNEVVYLVTLDESVGNFTVGNIGLYLNTGVLFAITALPQTQLKTQTTSGLIGNRSLYEIIINFGNAAALSNLTLLLEYAFNLAIVPSELVLPSPIDPPFNVYLVQNHSYLNIPCLAINYNSSWFYVPTQNPEPAIGGGIQVTAGSIASGINPGDAIYFNAAAGKFQLANPSISGYSQYAIGIAGYGNFIYFNNTVFTASGAPYVAGQTYYVNNSGASGNVVLSTGGGNIAAPIGYALSTNSLLVQPVIGNLNVAGNLTVGGLITANGGITIPQDGLDISFGIYASTTQNLANYIAMYSTAYGFNVTLSGVNYNTAVGQSHTFFVGGVEVLSVGGQMIVYASLFQAGTTNLGNTTITGSFTAGTARVNSLAFTEGNSLIYEDTATSDVVIRTGPGPGYLYSIFNSAGQLSIQPATATNQAVTLGQFTGGGNSNGNWRQYPDGTIEQWGNVGTADNATINFPIPFPNACLNVIVCESNPAGTWGANKPTVHAPSNYNTSGFEHWCLEWNGTAWASVAASCSWRAVGY